MKHPSVTVRTTISAPIHSLFDIVADPRRHPELAGSGEVQTIELLTPGPIGVGSGFQAKQSVRGFQYPTRSFVQVCERPTKFVWLSGPGFRRPPFGQLWGFEFQTIDSATTRVMHSSSVPFYIVPQFPPFSQLAEKGVRHEADNMRPTLHNLARMAGAEVVGDVETAFEPAPSFRPLLRFA